MGINEEFDYRLLFEFSAPLGDVNHQSWDWGVQRIGWKIQITFQKENGSQIYVVWKSLITAEI